MMFQMEIPRTIYLIFPPVSFFVCSFSKPVPTAKPAAKPLLIKGKVFQCHFIFIITQRKTFLLNSLLAFFQFVHSRKRLSLPLKFCHYYTTAKPLSTGKLRRILPPFSFGKEVSLPLQFCHYYTMILYKIPLPAGKKLFVDLVQNIPGFG